MPLTKQQKNPCNASGFVVVPTGLFDRQTPQQMIEHYMVMRAEGPMPGHYPRTSNEPDDSTHHYPTPTTGAT